MPAELRFPGATLNDDDGPLLESLLSCSWLSDLEEGRSLSIDRSKLGNWSSSVLTSTVLLLLLTVVPVDSTGTGTGSNTVLLLFLASMSYDWLLRCAL